MYTCSDCNVTFERGEFTRHRTQHAGCAKRTQILTINSIPPAPLKIGTRIKRWFTNKYNRMLEPNYIKPYREDPPVNTDSLMLVLMMGMAVH